MQHINVLLTDLLLHLDQETIMALFIFALFALGSFGEGARRIINRAIDRRAEVRKERLRQQTIQHAMQHKRDSDALEVADTEFYEKMAELSQSKNKETALDQLEDEIKEES